MTETNRLGILAFEGFEELDAVGPYEVFGNAAARGADWTVELLATEQTERVTAAFGMRVEPDGVLPGVPDGPPATEDGDPALDYLIVPGGGWNDRAQTGAWATSQDETVLDAIRALADAGTTVAAVCTGGMVLSAAGLLDGRPAVTHHSARDELAETGAEVVEARVVDDGDVLTAGGVTAGIDLALWLIEREWGHDVAYQVEDVIEHERSTDVYRGE
jgi:transcriptional regulator GlxA family with amidase domain